MAITYREGGLEVAHEHQFHAELDAGAVEHLLLTAGIPGRKAAPEERALDPGRVEEQEAEVIEPDGRQVEFAQALA